jgi:hypothetical protein
VGKVKEIADQPVTFAAKAIALSNPDIEFVSADEEAKTIVFRKTDTGEEAIFDFSDIQEGRFSWSDGDETVTMGAAEDGSGMEIRGPDGEVATFGGGDDSSIPDWVPRYDDADYESAFAVTSNGKASGTVTVRSDDSPRDVVAFYKRVFEDGNWAIQEHTMSADGKTHYTVIGTKDNLTVSVSVADEGSGAQGMVTYNEN